MSDFTFFKGNCPVCGGARKDCRQSTKTKLIFCRYENSNPLDYVYRGTDAYGFGLWVSKSDAEAASQERRLEWQRYQQQLQQQFEQELLERRKQALSPGQRDEQYRRLLGQLSLPPL